MIRYYSTNRQRTGEGFRPFTGVVAFREALMMGQAPDGGLFMPDRLPEFSAEEIGTLRGAPYWRAALAVGRRFWADAVPGADLEAIVRDAYDFEVPIERVEGRRFLLRLDRGPTASFKDFAARLMSRLMSYFLEEGARLKILVATSGDTGSAIGEAFKGVAGIEVYILYPAGEVSPRQKKQLDTIGGNVRALVVEGKFDDCQNLVKRAFLDPDLAELNLTSANSINIGRVLPQSIYYLWSYAQVAEAGEEAIISVPSGNFGNAFGCELARRMGLPLRKLVMPTNANDEFPDFLRTGLYRKVEPSRKCISNAMNVGHPSNLARFFDIYGGNIDRSGQVSKLPDLEEMRKRIFSVSVSDRRTRQTIVDVYQRHRIILEPHGAVGWKGLEDYLECTKDPAPAISVETAHPAKFPEEIESLLGMHPPVPPGLRDLESRRGEPVPLPGDYPAFKDFLLSERRPG